MFMLSTVKHRFCELYCSSRGTGFAVEIEGWGAQMRVLTFPKNRMKQAEKFKKAEAKQIFLSLSMVSLIMGALLLNDSLAGRNRPMYIVSENSSSHLQQLNRAIASAQPMDPFRDLEWEKQIANKLSPNPAADDRTPASVSRRISSMDELRYGSLAGNYRLVDQAQTEAKAGIREIEYVDPVDVMSKPVFLEPEAFLNKYGQLLSVSFDTYKASVQKDSTKEYELIKDQKVVGVAQFQMDTDGKFLGLKVRTSELQTQ